jgi:REP element-mobilizing transposase RayT
MSQSSANVIVHIVYSTKHRHPWLCDPVLRSELYAYNAPVLKNAVDSPAILITGMEDHVHIIDQCYAWD